MLANFEALFLEHSIKSKPLTISEKPNFEKKKNFGFQFTAKYTGRICTTMHTIFGPGNTFKMVVLCRQLKNSLTQQKKVQKVKERILKIYILVCMGLFLPQHSTTLSYFEIHLCYFPYNLSIRGGYHAA